LLLSACQIEGVEGKEHKLCPLLSKDRMPTLASCDKADAIRKAGELLGNPAVCAGLRGWDAQTRRIDVHKPGKWRAIPHGIYENREDILFDGISCFNCRMV
jgi:hypothetical protein